MNNSDDECKSKTGQKQKKHASYDRQNQGYNKAGHKLKCLDLIRFRPVCYYCLY